MFAFLNNIVLLTSNRDQTKLAIEKLQETSSKATRNQDRKVSQVHFKYLGETIKLTELNTLFNKERYTQLTWSHYNLVNFLWCQTLILQYSCFSTGFMWSRNYCN